MAEEIELKLSMQPQDLPRLDSILTHLGAATPQTQHLQNTYFDTPALDLHKTRSALRLRNTGQQWVQTLKTSGQVQGALSQRGEWEVQVEGPELKLELLPEKSLRPEWKNQLKPVFTTDFTRRSWLLEKQIAGSLLRVEVAADSGKVILPTGQQDNLCELELELKEGQAEQLFTLAEELAEHFCLHPAVSSKAERGLRLLQVPRKYQAPKLEQQTSFEALNELANHQLNEWILCHEKWAFAADELELQLAQRALFRLQGILVVQQRVCPSAPLHQARVDVKKLLKAFTPWVTASHADRVLQSLTLEQTFAENWRHQYLGYAQRRSDYRQLWQQKWTGQAGLKLVSSLYQSQCMTSDFAAEKPQQLLDRAKAHLRFPRQPMEADIWIQRYPALVRLELLLEQVEPQRTSDRRLAMQLIQGIGDLQGYQLLLAGEEVPQEIAQQLTSLRQELLFNLGRWAQALWTGEPGTERRV
ncbi:CYTH domain-containing protein [Marinospirillum celere]|uniref:CYTH domain-containing protein n=1 Tax=Marinospirillum celere TaxID=1122252 RepID=A0A1I1IQB4_9GAMM|nr:CYTH domain-containing protein [Marinospirillum celere]SFC38479.1 CYTH domain-containing protein [Marinospirillum celere]